MAFTMHSHSGQFCPGHAKDTLEAIIERAISLNMRLISLTEHMPRQYERDLYPEEIEVGDTVALLPPRHELYLQEALNMRAKYRGTIEILVGFEGEYIDPSYGPFVEAFARDPRVDFFIGSVHHVHTIPIDFDRAMYQQSRDVTDEKSDKGLFEKYFDEQFEMLKTLKPRVVAHFDIIRLFSDEPDRDWKVVPGVWSRIMRNLGFMKEQDMLLEVNSSALRKGLKEPYPGRSICEEFLRIGGKFTLSDDSHGVAQVGLNFEKVQNYLESIGVETLYYFKIEPGSLVANRVLLGLATVALKDLDLRAYPSTP